MVPNVEDEVRVDVLRAERRDQRPATLAGDDMTHAPRFAAGASTFLTEPSRVPRTQAAAGRMFWFTCRRLAGSNRRFREASRS